MKYSTEVTIELGIDDVIQKFDNTENMFKWQKGLKSFDAISGEAGQVGAKSKMTYQMGKRKIEMVETITHRNFPHEFHGNYEADGMFNKMENYFTSIDENKTKWKTISEFTGQNFAMRAMLFMMPGMFKKQTLKTMMDFKKFAEEN